MMVSIGLLLFFFSRVMSWFHVERVFVVNI